MKKWASIGLVFTLLLTLSTVSYAGDRQRGRWEGVAIGLGAVTLYNLFQHGYPSPIILPHHGYPRPIYHRPPAVHRPSGHWEIHREWIPERRERVWIPGHYEDGYWVEGHNEERVYPGCFTSENRLHKEVPNVRQAILACLFLINVMAFRGSFGLS